MQKTSGSKRNINMHNINTGNTTFPHHKKQKKEQEHVPVFMEDGNATVDTQKLTKATNEEVEELKTQRKGRKISGSKRNTNMHNINAS